MLVAKLEAMLYLVQMGKNMPRCWAIISTPWISKICRYNNYYMSFGWKIDDLSFVYLCKQKQKNVNKRRPCRKVHILCNCHIQEDQNFFKWPKNMSYKWMRNCHHQRAVWMFFVYIMITYLFTIFFYVKSAVCLVRVQLNLALYFRFGIVSLYGRSKLRPISQRRKIRFLNSTKSMQDCEYIHL